jgi:hypothetical protein
MGKASKRSTLVANSPLCKMYELGLSDGEAKGRRLERLELVREAQQTAPTSAWHWVVKWNAARSKRGKVGK